MNENQGGTNNLLDTTDCLEAVGVFKGWKNFFFIILTICIVLLQVCFWLVDTGLIAVPAKAEAGLAAGETQITILPIMAEVEQGTVQDVNRATSEIQSEPILPAEVNQAAESNKPAVPEIPADSNQLAEANKPVTMAEAEPAKPSSVKAATLKPAQPSVVQKAKGFLFGITYEHLVWVMRFVNAVAVLTATLYCLTILFSLKVSMLGRLGGINHITRAFFLSLLALVLLLPWNKVFDSVIYGAMFTPAEMVEWFSNKADNILGIALYYLRFCGYWVLVLLLLILAQLRSSRWSGAILRRLEVI